MDGCIDYFAGHLIMLNLFIYLFFYEKLNNFIDRRQNVQNIQRGNKKDWIRERRCSAITILVLLRC
jgi:hypothetical protein